MKKVLSIAAATAMLAIVACGPSADEKAKAEAAKLDSIEQQRIADSTLQAQEMAMTTDTTAVAADSTAAPAAEAPAAK
jgi:protein involved in sex pheromone biosynthesis